MSSLPIGQRYRIIEELVYERVRLDAEMLALAELEHELAGSLRRALHEVGGRAADLARLVDRAVELAVVRVTAELIHEADPPDGDCPMCEAPLACPAG